MNSAISSICSSNLWKVAEIKISRERWPKIWKVEEVEEILLPFGFQNTVKQKIKKFKIKSINLLFLL